MKIIYLVLCLVGIALPYFAFLPWLLSNGLHPQMFMQQLFANRVSAFFGVDVFISTLVVASFVGAESTRLHMGLRPRLLTLLALLAVGVSFALPLFLFMREDKLTTRA